MERRAFWDAEAKEGRATPRSRFVEARQDLETNLAALAERSPVTLHVLPEAVTTGGSGGGLDLASRGGITTVNMSTTLEDVTTTAEHLVVQAQQMFDRLLGEAVPRTDSISLIRSAEGQWKSQT